MTDITPEPLNGKSKKTQGNKAGWSPKRKRYAAKVALENGCSQTEAARLSGLAVETVNRLIHRCNEFAEAARKGEKNLVNIGLTGVTEIALNPEHPKQLEACQTLLKHERSGGYDGKSAVDLNIGWLPAGADREAFDV